MKRRNFLKASLAVSALPLAAGGAAADDSDAQVDQSPDISFVVKPYLQSLSENSVTITWVTDFPSVSWVQWGSDSSLSNQSFDIDKGRVVAVKRVHRIKLTGLEKGKKYYYRAISKRITVFKAYDVRYAKTVAGDVYSFTTPDNADSRVSAVFLNDNHHNLDMLKRLMPLAGDDFDFAIYGGDMINYIENFDRLHALLDTSSEIFAAGKPIVYARGNHEARGGLQHNLPDYIHLPNGEYYYAFTYGGVRFIILDSGEDKPDDNREYYSLARFSEYRDIQAKWIKEEINSSDFRNANFRVVIAHIPYFGINSDKPTAFGSLDCREKWAPLFNNKIDMMLSGHTHRYNIIKPESQHSYPIIIGGSPTDGKGTVMKLKADSKTLALSMIRDDGEQVGEWLCS